MQFFQRLLKKKNNNHNIAKLWPRCVKKNITITLRLSSVYLNNRFVQNMQAIAGTEKNIVVGGFALFSLVYIGTNIHIYSEWLLYRKHWSLSRLLLVFEKKKY